MKIPETMKVARLYSFGDIRIEEVPVPVPGPHEALVRVRASGICSGDVMPWYIEKKAPLVLGHEPAGDIVKVGEEVTSFREGEHVFVHHHAPCFLCPRCRRGDYVQCETWRHSTILPGGIAEYVLVPEVNLQNDTLSLPEDITYEDGAIIEPLACVVKGLRRARVMKGDTALVVGLGFMGMLNLMALKKFGASQVIGADMVPWRLEKALGLDADAVINASALPTHEKMKELTGGEGANIVIVCPNSAEALQEGIKCAAPGATVLMFTPLKPGETLSLEMNTLYFNDISLVTSYSCGPTDTADALDILRSGKIKAEQLVTHRFAIEDTAEAFRLTAAAGDSLKCMIVFD
jgi:L-iditol 2-dehydrogenase